MSQVDWTMNILFSKEQRIHRLKIIVLLLTILVVAWHLLLSFNLSTRRFTITSAVHSSTIILLFLDFLFFFPLIFGRERWALTDTFTWKHELTLFNLSLIISEINLQETMEIEFISYHQPNGTIVTEFHALLKKDDKKTSIKLFASKDAQLMEELAAILSRGYQGKLRSSDLKEHLS